MICKLFEFLIAEIEDAQTVDVSECDIVLADEFFELVDDLLYRSPFGDISSLERHELSLRV